MRGDCIKRELFSESSASLILIMLIDGGEPIPSWEQTEEIQDIGEKA